MNFYTQNEHDHTTRAPHRLCTPPVQPSGLCPFCRAPEYRSPGPCRSCGTVGYSSEISPLMAGRKTYRKPKGDPLNTQEECSEEDLLDAEEVQDFLLTSSLATVDPTE